MTDQPRHRWTDVRKTLHARVLHGTWRAGDKLPRDADIAADLGCARSTVQRAMQDLADSGIIERRRKGGTRVRADPVTRATLDIPIIRREVEATGARYRHRLLARSLARCPSEVAARFGLSAPREMLRIEALHLADDRPHILEDRWVCPRTVPEILTLDLTHQSANEWLVRTKPYSRCDLAMLAVTADAPLARNLDCAPGTALLAVERTTWIGDAPITDVRAVMHPGYRLETRA